MRYAYVGNNPLSYTDPSGMCFLGCFWKSPVFTAVASVAAAVTLNYEVLALEGVGGGTFAGAWAAGVGSATTGQALIAGAIAGAGSGAISSGGSLKGALIGAATADLMYGAGSLADTLPQGALHYAGEAAFDGAVGGLSSVASGGSFQSGFLAAGFSAATGPIDLGDPAGNVAFHAITGGVGAVLGGGKFENGAVTGAFSYLFNEAAHAAAKLGVVTYTNSDGSQDTYTGGSASWRDNNPGNMVAGAGPYQPIGSNNTNGFVIFADYSTGYNAMVDNLGTGRYQSQTVGGAIATWAPSSDGNDPVTYANNVKSWTGIAASTPMSSLTAAQIQSVANAIQRQEGWSVGTITHTPPPSN
jgi:hypothetical protein